MLNIAGVLLSIFLAMLNVIFNFIMLFITAIIPKKFSRLLLMYNKYNKIPFWAIKDVISLGCVLMFHGVLFGSAI